MSGVDDRGLLWRLQGLLRIGVRLDVAKACLLQQQAHLLQRRGVVVDDANGFHRLIVLFIV